MEKTEHPSLTRKSTLESLEATKSEIERLRVKTASLKETAQAIETELQSLDVIALIAGMTTKIDAFTKKYEGILNKVEANADAESELLAKAQKVLS